LICSILVRYNPLKYYLKCVTQAKLNIIDNVLATELFDMFAFIKIILVIRF